MAVMKRKLVMIFMEVTKQEGNVAATGDTRHQQIKFLLRPKLQITDVVAWFPI